ncbi:MAG: tetratricopeptide repeat protein [Acidobacteriota bacterium]
MVRDVAIRTLAAACLLVTPVTAAAQEASREVFPRSSGSGFATIQGRVLPARGERFLPDGITVTLTSQRRDFIRVKAPDAGGGFEFDTLAEGNYTLRVESSHHTPVEQSLVVAGSLRGEVVTVSIPLVRSREAWTAAPPRSMSSTVSAQLLSAPRKALQELQKADAASRRQDYRKAESHLRKALEIQPDLPEAYTNLGVQYIHLRKWNEAARCLRRAIELNANDALAHANLGVVYYQEGVLQEALRSLQHSNELQPGAYGTLLFLAETQCRMGDYIQARDLFRLAYTVNPEKAETLLRAADCEIKLMLYGSAAQSLREFIEAAPQDLRVEGVRSLLASLEARRANP